MSFAVVENIRSLAYRTDLAILSFQGRLSKRDDYIVAESPGNPGYFWGNLLLMNKPPENGDYEKWTRLFQHEFQHQALVKHMTFGWDAPDAKEGEIQPFLDGGFEVERSIVLTMDPASLRAPKHFCIGLEIRSISTDQEWEAALQNQIACRLKEFSIESYEPFKRIQMRKYRDMVETGLGKWFGAFIKGQLVADCGLFVFDGVGRYQAVGTSTHFRRRGICANLVFEAAECAFQKLGASRLVMVADPEYHAARVYQSVGFAPSQKAIGLVRRQA